MLMASAENPVAFNQENHNENFLFKGDNEYSEENHNENFLLKGDNESSEENYSNPDESKSSNCSASFGSYDQLFLSTFSLGF